MGLARFTVLGAVLLAVEDAMTHKFHQMHIFTDSWAMANQLGWQHGQGNGYVTPKFQGQLLWNMLVWVKLAEVPVTLQVTQFLTHSRDNTMETVFNCMQMRQPNPGYPLLWPPR